jgi:A/G-specific adenine glycosylase
MKASAPARKRADFQGRLLRWYGRHRRDLPWRRTSDPYATWISEVMLQQTTVATVIPRYERWMKEYPNIGALAAASPRRVLKSWQGLGYYARAKNLHKAARIISEKYSGRIPESRDVLLELPGFGPYTSAAVLSLAYRKPFPVIDANVRRVVMRLALIRGQAGAAKDKAAMTFLRPLFSEKRPGDFNQAMMELGALVCRPKTPLCLLCPVLDFCKAFRAGEQEVIPAPRKRASRQIEAVVGIIRDGGKFLIQQRPSSGLLADLWEFPGGKRKPGETLEGALRREIREELGAGITDIRPFMTVRHSYTEFRVILHAFHCFLREPLKTGGLKARWVTLRAMRQYPFPSGSARIVEKLEKEEPVF